MLFGGFIIGTDSIPAWLAWIKWISFLIYAFGAIMANEFSDRTLSVAQCSPEDTFCPAQGREVLEFFQLTELTLWENVACLVGLMLGLRAIAYLILRARGPTYDTSV